MSNRSLRIQAQHIQKANNALTSLGLTKKEFAETRLQLSRSTVSNCLNGKSVSKENFVRICQVLKLDWEEMAGLKINSVDNAQTSDKQKTENNNIDGLVNKLREQVQADIETRCGTMRILDMSQPIGLDDIYTKVNILEKISGHRRKDITELTKSYDIENFDRFNFGQVKEKISGKEAVNKYQKLLILGKPGAGKTTFLKHLVIKCSRGLFQGNLVPFFITLKEFAEAEDRPKLFDYLYLYPPQYLVTKDIDSTALQKILIQGKALICLDGLDEVLAANSKRVIKEIESLVHKYPNNQYLMTCRIAAKEYTFTQFTEVEIADFDREQISIFVTNWFKNKPIKPETFLSRLENDEPIQELASNPLLLTLLCLVFEESGSFPGNRAALYKEGIDALLKKWDAKRGIQRDEIYQKLWTQRKEDLLSKLAWETFSQGEYFFKQDKAERYIGEYIRNLPGVNQDEEALKLDSEAVLKSIESQHGLLVERAKGIYSFSHLTFQEYFAAREIIVVRQSSDQAVEELVSHLFDKRWREVFLLAVAMSPNANKLVLLAKDEIDTSIKNESVLQELLSLLIDIILKKSELENNAKHRAFYLTIACVQIDLFQFNVNFELSKELGLQINREYLERNSLLLWDFIFVTIISSSIHLSKENAAHWMNANINDVIYIDNSNSVFVNLAYVIDYIIQHHFDQKLIADFVYLRKQLPELIVEKFNNNIVCLESYDYWWKHNSNQWRKNLIDIIDKYAYLACKLAINKQQKIKLQQYLYGTLLLIHCINSECYIDLNLRRDIKETLLLPIAEIEKHKNNLSNQK